MSSASGFSTLLKLINIAIFNILEIKHSLSVNVIIVFALAKLEVTTLLKINHANTILVPRF